MTPTKGGEDDMSQKQAERMQVTLWVIEAAVVILATLEILKVIIGK